MQIPIQFIFSDGKSCSIPVEQGEEVLSAAQAAGLSLLVDCKEGVCGTCQAQVACGVVGMKPFSEGLLSAGEIQDGAALMCRAIAQEAAVIELPYSSDDAQMQGEERPLTARVLGVRAVADDTVTLTVGLEEPFQFLPGQYVNLSPEPAIERSFSMANAPGANTLTFHIAMRPDGRFSNWLKATQPGAALQLGSPRGTFYLRDDQRPKLMIAGGTGLAPILAMLKTLAEGDEAERCAPITVLLGARTDRHLFELDALERLRQQLPGLEIRIACDEVSDGARVQKGRVTQLLSELAVDGGATVYACGPPPMIEAVRQVLKGQKFPMKRFMSEKFTA